MRKDISKIFTKEFLEQELKTKFKRQIAEENNISEGTVYNYMKRHGLKAMSSHKKYAQRLLGQKCGRLEILDYAGYDKFGKTLLKCRCDCGKETIVNQASINRQLTASCGCLKTEKLRKGGYKDISQQYFRRIIDDCLRRHVTFDITKEYVWGLYEKQDRKCALSGVPIVFQPNFNNQVSQTASIDRIKSDKGYIEGNIQIVHKRINILKGNLPEEELKFWVYNMYHHLGCEETKIENFKGPLDESKERKENKRKICEA